MNTPYAIWPSAISVPFHGMSFRFCDTERITPDTSHNIDFIQLTIDVTRKLQEKQWIEYMVHGSRVRRGRAEGWCRKSTTLPPWRPLKFGGQMKKITQYLQLNIFAAHMFVLSVCRRRYPIVCRRANTQAVSAKNVLCSTQVT